jgi:hypothetical protein
VVVSCKHGNEPSASIIHGKFLDSLKNFLRTLLHEVSPLSIQDIWSVNLSTVLSLHNWLFFLCYNNGKRIHGQMHAVFVHHTITKLPEISTGMYYL